MFRTFFLLLSSFILLRPVQAQNRMLDSLMERLISHPKIDSEYVLTLHRISYRLSEKDISRAFYYYEKVVAFSDSLNFTYGKSLAQINLGLLLNASANFDASNNAYFIAIEYAERCGALRLKAVSLNNIGENFKVLKDYIKCRKYTNEAIELNSKIKAWRGVAINYELLQACDLAEKKYADAKNNLLLGMPYAEKAHETYIFAQYFIGFGKLKAVENDNDSATFYFAKAMEQARQQEDLRNEFLCFVAQTEYLKNLSFSKKIILLDSALAIARKTSYLEDVAHAAQQLSSIYEENELKDSSIYYYHIYRTAADSLFSENNKRNVIINESEWKIKREEIENNQLTILSKIQHKDLAIKNVLLIVVCMSLLLSICIAFFIYKNSNTEKRRTEAALKQKIAEIQMQVLRAQMNPHFIFNSLNSIENFMMQNEKRMASDYLNKFTSLIRTILDSSLNELIPISKDMEALQLYIDLQQLRFNKKFTYITEIQPKLLNGDYKVPSLIIQPFVENAIEHGLAHSEKAELTLSIIAIVKGDSIEYTIKDNGVGRVQSAAYNQQNKPQHHSLGLAITADRIHIFNGDLCTEDDITITDLYDADKNPAGTSISVKIKIT